MRRGWCLGLVLVAWVLWSQRDNLLKSMPGQPPATWTMEEAFETKRECEEAKAKRLKSQESVEATHRRLGRPTPYFFNADYSCWPNTVDPRPK
jgi:hypothetical protein